MHRCFIDPNAWQPDGLQLSAEEAHHLLDVLRACVGDSVTAFDGAGREAVARLVASPGSVGGVRLDVIETTETRDGTVELILIQALPKGKRMDLIVEKTTELGVTELRPVITDRTVVRPRADRASARVERWRRIATGAAKQCGRGRVPAVKPLASLKAALDGGAPFDLLLMGSLAHAAKPLRDILRSRASDKTRRVGVIVGPEGDLTDAEQRLALSAGAISVTFGALTLRAETAAIFAISVLAYELTR